MTLISASSKGRAQDALSGRPKVAIVTGGSSGIGLEMVKRLIEKGYRVVANSRNITSAMTLHNTADLKLVDGDIGLEETAKRVVSAAIQNFETIPSPSPITPPKIFEGERRQTWQDSSMCRNSRWRKCACRNSDTSSTSPRRNHREMRPDCANLLYSGVG